jgi:hypothetical protein
MAALLAILKIQEENLNSGRYDSDGAGGLDEGFLRQVLRELAVAHHAVEQGEDRPLVAADQLPVGRLAARPGHEDDLLVSEAEPLGGVSHPCAALPRLSPQDYIERLC